MRTFAAESLHLQHRQTDLQDWILLTETEHPATRSSRVRAVA